RWCMERDDAILASIADYNKDDCISTEHLRSCLEGMRPPGVAAAIVDEPTPQQQERSNERAYVEAQKQALAARVRDCGCGDGRVRELVAELLWFHQRSQKPAWWEVFERQAWSEDELVDDADCLGGLRADPDTPPVEVKRSLDTAYVFRPQDTKLK